MPADIIKHNSRFSNSTKTTRALRDRVYIPTTSRNQIMTGFQLSKKIFRNKEGKEKHRCPLDDGTLFIGVIDRPKENNNGLKRQRFLQSHLHMSE